MKPNFLYCVLLLGALASCKQLAGKEADIDPRDQYVGLYGDGIAPNPGYSGQVLIGSIPQERPSGTVSITVAKAAAPKELTLTLLYNKGKQFEQSEKLTAELNGNKFTIIDKKMEQITVGITTIEGIYTAFGEFVDNNKFTMVTNVEKDQAGTIVKKTIGIVGIKK